MEFLTNSDLSELLATASDSARQPLQKALRRASRQSLSWMEEASQLVRENRSLEELRGIGPSLSRMIHRWLEDPPAVPARPEVRRGFLTVPEARCILKTKPSWLRGVRGDLQMHSVWSDGTDSIEEMARAGAARGYDYIAITDHAKKLKIAGGMDERQLARQAEEVVKVNEIMRASPRPIRVLHSIELNLDPAGNGDMDSSALSRLDLVLGCFHSALRKKEEQTDRYLAALRNPTVHILGHPRGRIYNFRPGLNADWRRVFDLAAELDKAVEIDSYPDRQDLSRDLAELAAKAGCRISIGTDSHHSSQLRFIELGLASALSAGIKRERILNFMNAEELLDWAAALRHQQGPASVV